MYSARVDEAGEVLSTTQFLGGVEERHLRTRRTQASRVLSVSWFCRTTRQCQAGTRPSAQIMARITTTRTYDMDVTLRLEMLLEEAGLARARVSNEDDDFRRLLLVEFGQAAGEERRRGGRVERGCGARDGSGGVTGRMRLRRTVVVVGRGVPAGERPVLAHRRAEKKLLGREKAQAAVDGELCGTKKRSDSAKEDKGGRDSLRSESLWSPGLPAASPTKNESV